MGFLTFLAFLLVTIVTIVLIFIIVTAKSFVINFPIIINFYIIIW